MEPENCPSTSTEKEACPSGAFAFGASSRNSQRPRRIARSTVIPMITASLIPKSIASLHLFSPFLVYITGARAKIRTWDRSSISRVLYQLSYACSSRDTTRNPHSLPETLERVWYSGSRMVHRGSTRESKRIREFRVSTIEDKYRRHKNKERIWKRCVTRLAFIQETS